MFLVPLRRLLAVAALASVTACSAGSIASSPVPAVRDAAAAPVQPLSLAALTDSVAQADAPAAARGIQGKTAGTTVLFHEFKTECDTDGNDADRDVGNGEPAFLDLAQDPIVHPGDGSPAMQHVHTFFGNLGISPTADAAALLAAPSTCNMVGGHQAWWIPQASLDGVPVHPTAIVVYYKLGPDFFSGHVVPFPQGIKILAGSSAQSQDDFRKIGSWTCGTLPRTSDVPDSCAPGTDLVVRLAGPHCMADLTATDSPTHRTHIVYSVSGTGQNANVCPADHPIAVPMPVWKISYAVSGGNLKSRFKLSAMRPDGSVGPAGPAWSFHADELFAFDSARFAHLVDYCINGGRQCQHTGDGPHLTR